jgi:uncharacterized BrkB/YihY/UPF0761 family membrane protein
MSTPDPPSRLEDPETPAPPPAGDQESATEGATEGGMRERVVAARVWGQHKYERLEQKRPQSQPVEVGFRWFERDVQIAGGVLGGGLAYRFFFWVLSLSVLFSGGLGFASRSGANLEEAAAEAGLTGAVSDSVASAAEASESGRLALLLLGVWLTVWFSWGLLRALRLVHGAAWRIRPQPMQRPLMALVAVLAAPLVLIALVAAAGWVRANVGTLPGFFATLAAGAAFGAAWLRISMRLPSHDVRWTAFVPGAVFMGVGIEILHLFTVYFLADKLASAQSHYGALGLAATMLFYLWMIGRGVVWAAELNAVVWNVRHPRDTDPTEPGRVELAVGGAVEQPER